MINQTPGIFKRNNLIGFGGNMIERQGKQDEDRKSTGKNSKAHRLVKGFQVLPRRCVVERTFGWLGRFDV
jgi:transposase